MKTSSPTYEQTNASGVGSIPRPSETRRPILKSMNNEGSPSKKKILSF